MIDLGDDTEVCSKLLLRGTIKDNPGYVKGGGETRCVFEMMVVTKEKIGETGERLSAVRFRVITDPSIVDKCKEVAHREARVTVAGTLIDVQNNVIRIKATSVAAERLVTA